MNQIYKVNVNNSFDFDVSPEQVSSLDAIKMSASQFHVL
ncbi:MAG TPA: acetyl-CoA carboxylase biotin carboxyl carrier protein subunit, partial [Xanthomarina gelatinilytica]|nr:acetyl-CoA carboxylase biotin carboxyl carrier protein subunit [Xanthomarina gelatinilytica]